MKIMPTPDIPGIKKYDSSNFFLIAGPCVVENTEMPLRSPLLSGIWPRSMRFRSFSRLHIGRRTVRKRTPLAELAI